MTQAGDEPRSRCITMRVANVSSGADTFFCDLQPLYLFLFLQRSARQTKRRRGRRRPPVVLNLLWCLWNEVVWSNYRQPGSEWHCL